MGRLLLVSALAIAMAAVMLTGYTYLTLDRYQVFEGEYLRNTEFARPGGEWGFDLADVQAPTGWSGERRGGDIRFVPDAEGRRQAVIENADPKGRVLLTQDIDLNGQHRFELSAMVSTNAVVKGSRPWHVARVDFAGLLPDDSRDHGRPHVLFDGQGTIEPRRMKGFFDLDPAVERARLTLQLSQATGRFTIGDLQLKPAAYDPYFLLMDKLSRASWLAFLVIIAVLFWRGAAHKAAAAGAIILVIGGAGLILLPNGIREVLSASFSLPGGGDEWTGRALHFLGFVCASFLITLARRRERPRQVLPWLLVIAVFAELIQLVSGGLGLDDVLDMAINLAGAIVGWGMAEEHIKSKYGGRRKRRRKHRAEVDLELKQA